MNGISWQLPALMLSSFFSVNIVGFYSLGLVVLKMPLNIISSALSQVFYQKACEGKNVKGCNDELVESLMDKLMFIGILPTMILAIVGEELFSVVFGEKWFAAGSYTQILAPWAFSWFISSPLSTLFAVYERQGAALSVDFVFFITRFFSLYIGGIYNNIYLALGLFSVTGIAAYAFLAAWNIKIAKASLRKIFLMFMRNLLYSLPVGICLFFVKYMFKLSPIAILVIAVIIGGLHVFTFRSKYLALTMNH